MGRKRHKRKNSHVVIVTSDAVDAGVRQFRIRPGILRAFILVFCVLVGALIGYVYYDRNEKDQQVGQTTLNQETVEALEQEKAELEAQVASLNETIQILSETVNQKTQNEAQLTEQLEKQTLPTEFPLTSPATMEEISEGDAICVFTAANGAMVVATAGGTVTAVNDDSEYGHNVWVDHGNGYVTVYRNSGEVKVKQGETVNQGATLFIISDESSKLGYQVMKDGVYINPMDVIKISG